MNLQLGLNLSSNSAQTWTSTSQLGNLGKLRSKLRQFEVGLASRAPEPDLQNLNFKPQRPQLAASTCSLNLKSLQTAVRKYSESPTTSKKKVVPDQRLSSPRSPESQIANVSSHCPITPVCPMIICLFRATCQNSFRSTGAGLACPRRRTSPTCTRAPCPVPPRHVHFLLCCLLLTSRPPGPVPRSMCRARCPRVYHSIECAHKAHRRRPAPLGSATP